MITAGPIYTYIDYAMGKNQPWLTDAFGKGLGSGVEMLNGIVDLISTWVLLLIKFKR